MAREAKEETQMKIPPAIFAFAFQLLDAGRYAEALALARIEWDPEPFDAACWNLENSMFLSMRTVRSALLPTLSNALDDMAWALQ